MPSKDQLEKYKAKYRLKYSYFSVVFPRALQEEILQLADADKRSISHTVRIACKRYIEHRKTSNSTSEVQDPLKTVRKK